MWQAGQNEVIVRCLSQEESQVQEALVREDVERFRATLDELASIKHVGAAEKGEALFHRRVAEENLGTAAWRGGESVRFCVLREGTRHSALASLLVEKRL